MKLNSIFNTFLRPFSKVWFSLRNRSKTSKEIFTEKYKKNLWGGISRSGPGSDLIQTKTIRIELPKLFKELKINSLLDIPCGDFYWLKEVDLNSLNYIGADIVEDIIIHNKENFSKKNITFTKLDIISDSLPKVDLIFCRDLFQHLSNDDILKSIKNIKKSDSKFFLSSSQISTQKNNDIKTGQWRRLNLLLPPFSFPKPLKMVNEQSTIKQSSGKCLFLWEISDI